MCSVCKAALYRSRFQHDSSGFSRKRSFSKMLIHKIRYHLLIHRIMKLFPIRSIAWNALLVYMTNSYIFILLRPVQIDIKSALSSAYTRDMSSSLAPNLNHPALMKLLLISLFLLSWCSNTNHSIHSFTQTSLYSLHRK